MEFHLTGQLLTYTGFAVCFFGLWKIKLIFFHRNNEKIQYVTDEYNLLLFFTITRTQTGQMPGNK